MIYDVIYISVAIVVGNYNDLTICGPILLHYHNLSVALLEILVSCIRR